MKTLLKRSFRELIGDWLAQEKDHRFGSVSNSDKQMKKNGNLDLVAAEDIELVVFVGTVRVTEETLLVPKGARVTIFRPPASAAPGDTVATVFADDYQASLKGNGRTVVRRHSRPTRSR